MGGRADYLSAAGWAVLGAVILFASLRMDRLANLGINPWSVPGLTPGVVGVLMILLAAALAAQAWRAGRAPRSTDAAVDVAAGAAVDIAADADAAARVTRPGGSVRRTLAAALICIGFAGLTLGHGWPFAVEGAVFNFAFTAVFSWSAWRAEQRIVGGLLQTLVVAVVAASFIAWLFESVFLVRLP